MNAKNKNRWTALHEAAFGGRKETVELLISNGAHVNAKTKNDQTSLDFAIRFKRTKTAELLRKHGGKTGKELKTEGKPAEPRCRSCRGRTTGAQSRST
ncbi:MAG: ankyrin repeat domain-containing protein [Planctomycetota bacterium]|nr:ankyrin repeat domain-containing protein [Planctomycetota bacterium]MDP7518090.1 ankyrin repeat domain-containing protein [Arenicellales bacterium]